MGNHLSWRSTRSAVPVIDRELNVQQPWFDEIMNGRKTVEGRVGKLEQFNYKGKRIAFKYASEIVIAVVSDVVHYDSLDAYIRGEGFAKVAPQTDSDDAAIAAYLSVTADDKQVFDSQRVTNEGGIVAIRFDIVKTPQVQPQAVVQVQLQAAPQVQLQAAPQPQVQPESPPAPNASSTI